MFTRELAVANDAPAKVVHHLTQALAIIDAHGCWPDLGARVQEALELAQAGRGGPTVDRDANKA